jgi:uncharacterized protein (TIGR03083 family)
MSELETTGAVQDRPPWRIVFRPGRDRRLWRLVEAQRLALAERLESLTSEDWDQPSRCEGWRTRDVLGHLVHMAESTGASMRADVRRTGGFDEGAKRLGELGGAELCRRLRLAAASHYNGMPVVALSEVVVHGDDILGPLGQRMDSAPDSALPVLRLLHWVDLLVPRFAYQSKSHRGVRLVATDIGWSAGRGPHLKGSALDLAALLTNRAGALDALTGPGVARLRKSHSPTASDTP